MNSERFENVFDALEDDKAEAANLTARADFIIAIRHQVGNWGLSQQQAAERLGITRPRLNDLLRGKIDKFSLDALANIAAKAGLKVSVQRGGVIAA